MLIALLHLAGGALAQNGLLPKLNVEKGLWVEGYDPVAYLVDQRAEKGNARYAFQLEGATFHFASQAHKDLFAADPARYLPQYGGWCAYAMGAKNEKVEVDPETFKAKNGKVYLFYNRFFTNTLDDWNAYEPRLLPAADRNWKAFKHATTSTPGR
jgi:YHS domain-containing protein